MFTSEILFMEMTSISIPTLMEGPTNKIIGYWWPLNKLSVFLFGSIPKWVGLISRKFSMFMQRTLKYPG